MSSDNFLEKLLNGVEVEWTVLVTYDSDLYIS